MVDTVDSHVPVVWKTGHSEADRLLGKIGRPVLDRVVERMQWYAKEHKWPLEQIDIVYRQDMEFPDWEMIWVNPVFDVSSDEAETFLAGFLQEVDLVKAHICKARNTKFGRAIWFGFDITQ